MQLRALNVTCFAFSVVMIFFVAISIGLAASPASATDSSTIPTSSVETIVSLIKDVVNILFFMIIATLGVMSYLQARKTLFTPFRTETLKYQLKLFEEVLLVFQADTVMQFDLRRILNLNAEMLFEEYVKLFFGEELKIDEARREARRKQLIGGIFKTEDLEEITGPVFLDRKGAKEVTSDSPTNPAVVLAQWYKYEHRGVEYTAKFDEQTEKLRLLRASPLMPKGLRELIQQFEKAVHRNMTAISGTLTEIAKEMPEKYPTAQSLSNADFSWIWNRYNKKREHLDKLQEDILRYVSDYLRVDEIGG